MINIALIEDDEIDQRIVKMSFKQSELQKNWIDFNNADSAIQFINSTKNENRADLFIIDLNLPRINGMEIIRKIRESPFYKITPILVLSTSIHPDDIKTCYKHGANACLTKGVDLPEISEKFSALEVFWLKHCLLPSKVD